MNLLVTTVFSGPTLESEACVRDWRARHHIVEVMPIHRLTAYLRLDPASALALIDAIICVADDSFALEFIGAGLQVALAVAGEICNLPGQCTMRDGRKWNSIPFVIFSSNFNTAAGAAMGTTHAKVRLTCAPFVAINQIQNIVNDYQDRMLDDYSRLGILVRFKGGRAQIGPALKRKDPHAETEYYYAPGDRRKNKDWVTIRRDSDGVRQDVEMFQALLERNASETEMHKFFEEHPAILMEARLAIPVSHEPSFVDPKLQTPDFAFCPILGPIVGLTSGLLELKGPAEQTLTKGLHRGFTAKVHRAVDQVRDYVRYLRDPKNLEALLKSLGYVPTDPQLAVLIGRAPRDEDEKTTWRQRQSELDVEVVTYDEIFQKQVKQANQARESYTLLSGTDSYPLA